MGYGVIGQNHQVDFFTHANTFFERGAYGPAVHYYYRAIEQYGPRDIYFQNLVLALRFQGDIASCQREVRNGLAHNPTNQSLRDLLIELNDEYLTQHVGPALSIIVPVYNSGQYLETCLRSILQQTFRDFELIVINDGSQDQSGEIIERLAAEDDRIHVIWHDTPSGNPGTPRNRALEIARGAYIGFVDSDDWIDPDFYEELMGKAHERCADIVFSGGFVNHSVIETSVRKYKNQGFENPDSPRYKYHDSFMIWDKVFNAQLVKAFDIRLGETRAAVDVPFVFRAYYWSFLIAYCDHTVAYHYRRESDSSVTVNYRKSSDCQFELQAYALIWDWADQHNVPEYFRDVIRYKQINSYTYTLSVIAPDYFHDFYAHCQKTFRTIRRDVVLRFSNFLKKNHIVKKYDAVTTKPPKKYAELYREDLALLPESSVKPYNWDPECTYFIEGDHPGVLFFPDWSRSNPYQKLLYGALASEYNIKVKGFRSSSFTRDVLEANRAEFSCIHLHWLQALMDFSTEDGADAFFDALAYAKELGYKVIYTAHNIVSHDTDHEAQERDCRHRAVQQFDHLLAHGEYAKERLIDEVGADEEKISIVPHGAYEGYYPNHVDRHVARHHFSLADDDFVFLFFGNIKGYKGVDLLLEVFDGIRRDCANARLIIAGRVFEAETAQAIRRHAEAHPSIIFHPGFIDDKDAQYYFNAADLMVLPYRRILTSGAALLSLSYRLPLLAPRTGLLPELIEEGKQGYLFDDYAHMARLMRKALQTAGRSGASKDDTVSFDFDGINKKLRWTEIVRGAPFSELFGEMAERSAPERADNAQNYVIVRLIGNDLLSDGLFESTCEALNFTLGNESAFAGCEKIWVLNQLADSEKKQLLASLLDNAGAQWVDWPLVESPLTEAPFAFDELPQSDFKRKPGYEALDEKGRVAVDLALLRYKRERLLGKAEALNRAFELGAERANWVLLLQGTEFVAESAWKAILRSVHRRSDLRYHVLPVDSVEERQDLLDEDYEPLLSSECRMMLRRDASLRFEYEGSAYGPELPFLVKLGVSGYWDKSISVYPWQRQYIHGEPGTFCYAWSGWIGRCEPEIEVGPAGSVAVEKQRQELAYVKQCDQASAYRNFSRGEWAFYRQRSATEGERQTLQQLADEGLAQPVVTVVDKTTMAPSLDKHDYWCAAPYAWPDESSATGLPYVFRRGRQVPGTEVYQPTNRQYDRAPLQQLFETTTVLALAGHFLGNADYIKRAYEWVRAWFVVPESAMNPNFNYARVIRGHHEGLGAPEGVTDAKDFHYVLDAVRIVQQSEFWTSEDEQAINRWFNAYLLWLQDSVQGKTLAKAESFHGTAFDLQVYAVAAFLGYTDVMYESVLRAVSRVPVMDVKGEGRNARLQLRLWSRLSTLVANTSVFDLSDFSQWRLSEGEGCLERLQRALPEVAESGDLRAALGAGNAEEAIPPLSSLANSFTSF